MCREWMSDKFERKVAIMQNSFQKQWKYWKRKLSAIYNGSHLTVWRSKQIRWMMRCYYYFLEFNFVFALCDISI